MNLPQFLESDDGGFVQFVGHRIGLHHLLRLYLEGASPEMIAAQYPSLSLSLIHYAIGFYLDNQSEVDEYMRNHDGEMGKQMEAAPRTPTVLELRQRLQQMRATELKVGRITLFR